MNFMLNCKSFMSILLLIFLLSITDSFLLARSMLWDFNNSSAFTSIPRSLTVPFSSIFSISYMNCKFAWKLSFNKEGKKRERFAQDTAVIVSIFSASPITCSFAWLSISQFFSFTKKRSLLFANTVPLSILSHCSQARKFVWLSANVCVCV